MSRIDREGRVAIGNHRLSVLEEGIPRDWDARKVWERQFKKDIFKRIIQTMGRCGWASCIPPEDIKQYGMSFATGHRYFQKGFLRADLSLCGRCIEIEFYQNVVVDSRDDHWGRYDHNNHKVIPYMMGLEIRRMQNRISSYLCNVFTGYAVKPQSPERGSSTALDIVDYRMRNSGHFDEALGRCGGDDRCGNNKSADGSIVKHGERVWFFDSHGRIATGTAFYDLNMMWHVVTGKYDFRVLPSWQLMVKCPEDFRVKRNEDRKQRTVGALLESAVKSQDFERAIILRDAA